MLDEEWKMEEKKRVEANFVHLPLVKFLKRECMKVSRDGEAQGYYSHINFSIWIQASLGKTSGGADGTRGIAGFLWKGAAEALMPNRGGNFTSQNTI